MALDGLFDEEEKKDEDKPQQSSLSLDGVLTEDLFEKEPSEYPPFIPERKQKEPVIDYDIQLEDMHNPSIEELMVMYRLLTARSIRPRKGGKLAIVKALIKTLPKYQEKLKSLKK